MPRAQAPAALRLLGGRSEGRDSGGRPVAAPPAFRRIAPNPPTWMSREAKAEWKRVAPGLQRLDLLKEEDRAALTVYCETWARWVKATREVERVGLTVPTDSGSVKRNPAVAVAEIAGSQLRAYAQEFGLTPSAEGKLARGEAAGDDDDSPFA